MISPLGGAARKITANGGWLAPRWNIGATSSTGDAKKVPGKPRPPDRFHEAIDLAAARGEVVRAPIAGHLSIPAPGRGGVCLKIEAGPLSVVLCDLGRITAKAGPVKEGDPIAIAGDFVHVAIKLAGKAADPRLYIPTSSSSPPAVAGSVGGLVLALGAGAAWWLWG